MNIDRKKTFLLSVLLGAMPFKAVSQTIPFEEIVQLNTYTTISRGIFSQDDNHPGDVTRLSFSPTDDVFISRHQITSETQDGNFSDPIYALVSRASESVNGFTLPFNYAPALERILQSIARLPEARGKYLGLSMSVYSDSHNLNPTTNQALRFGIFLADDTNTAYFIPRQSLLRPGDLGVIANHLANGGDFSDYQESALLMAAAVTGVNPVNRNEGFFRRNFSDSLYFEATERFPASTRLYSYSHTQKAIVLTERFSRVRGDQTELMRTGNYYYDRPAGFYLNQPESDPVFSNHIRSLAFRIAQILQGEPHGLSIRAVMNWLHYLSFQPEADNHYLGALVNYDRGYPRIHFFYTSNPEQKPVNLSNHLIGSLELTNLQLAFEAGAGVNQFYSFINSRTGNTRIRNLPAGFIEQADADYAEHLANLPVTDETIAQYAPRVLLHPYEYTMPMAAEDFLAQARLKYRDEGGAVTVTHRMANDITADEINDNPQWQWFADIPNARQDAVYRGARVNNQNRVEAPVYVRLLDVSNTHTDIQYMMFYPYNGCQNLRVAYLAPQNPLSTHRRNVPLCNLARHEGDWEHVTVRVNNDTQEAEAVFMSGHGSGDWYGWNGSSDLQLINGHPVVYSALNSHAGYATVGTFTDEDLGEAVTAAGVTLGTFNGTPVTSAKVVDTTNRDGSLRFDHYPNRRQQPVWETWRNIIRVEDTDWHDLNLKWGNNYDNVSGAFSLPNMEGNAENTVITVARVAADIGLLDRFRHGSSPRTLTQQSSSQNLGAFFKPTASFGDLGSSGGSFNDQHVLGEIEEVLKVTRIGLRAGRRIDQVFMEVAMDGEPTLLSHGESGGNERSLTLEEDEYVTQINLHLTRHNGSDRLSYLRYVTNKGRFLEGGNPTDRRFVIRAEVGQRLVGFYGRSGDEVDNLGALQAPVDRLRN